MNPNKAKQITESVVSEYQDDLVCPFCGEKQFPSAYLFELGEGATECDKCKKEFNFSSHITTKWKAEINNRDERAQ